MLPIQPYTLRPTRWIHMALIALSVVCVGYLIEQETIERKDYPAIFCIVLITSYSVLAMKRVMIYIDNDGFVDHKIFSKTFIAWKEITAADIVFEGSSHGIRSCWVLERANKQPYKMHLSYKLKNANIFAEALVTKCAGARLSNKIIKLSEGKRISILLD